MSDDWQVGDLALCVDDSPCPCCGWAVRGLTEDQTYVVGDVRAFPDSRFGELLFLGIVGIDDPETDEHIGGWWVDAESFRKIRPDEHEPCEAEFRILLQLSKKRVSA